MTSGKTLLIISGGLEAADAAHRAKEMGLAVVMADGDTQAPGFAFADSCLIADIHQPADTAAAAERYNRKIRKIDGVIGIAANTPVTVATVAARLRLPGLPLHVAELAAERLALKKCFLSAGVPSPWFSEVRTPQELQRLVITHGRDLLLAPADGRDDAGVVRIAGAEDLVAAFQLARSHSPNEKVMVEKFPAGPRLFTESLISAGRCHTPLIADQGREGPSHQPPAILGQARALAARAAQALGISEGTQAVEMAIQDGQLEVTGYSASLSGFFCTQEIPRHAGMDFVGAAIRLALGEPLSEVDLKA